MNKSVLSLFEEKTSRNSKLAFPADGVGTVELKRQTLVDEIINLLEGKLVSDEGPPASLYIQGMKASGKTILLELLAKKLQAKGYRVYYSVSAKGLMTPVGWSLKDSIPVNDDKVAVLIDEVQSNPASAVVHELLKDTKKKNLITIAAGIPLILRSGEEPNISSKFKFKKSAELRLQSDSLEMQELVAHWQGLNVVDSKVVEDVCVYLQDYCGGHFFSTVKLMEYAFTMPAAIEAAAKSMDALSKYFLGHEFQESKEYRNLLHRCFGEDFDRDTEDRLSRTLAGQGHSSDIAALQRLGWWSEEKQDVLSTFLRNVCLSRIKPAPSDDVIQLKAGPDPKENMETIIVKGLEGMQVTDFVEGRKGDTPNTNIPVEDSLSFNWGSSVKRAISNVRIQFQSRAREGQVVFVCNGVADCAIETQRNATWPVNPDVKGQSMPEHLKRFFPSDNSVPAKNEWTNFAILNFVVAPGAAKKELVLPASASLREHVYTYVHDDNKLYHGSELIKCPAVLSLQSQTPHKYVPLSKRKMAKMPSPGQAKAFFSSVSDGAAATFRLVHFSRRLVR